MQRRIPTFSCRTLRTYRPLFRKAVPSQCGQAIGPVYRALGVLFGNNEVAIAEHLTEVDAFGNRTPETQRIISFGLAHHTSVLLKLAGSATGNKALADIVL